MSLEHRFLVETPAFTLSGVIDRIDRCADGTYEIIDYKTNKKLPSVADLQRDIQLPLYQLAAERVLGIKPGRLTFYYLVPDQRYSTSPQPSERMAELERHVADIAARIEAGDFAPRPNHLCPWCDFSGLCEAAVNGADRIPRLVDAYAELLEKRRLLEDRIASTESDIVDCAGKNSCERLESPRHCVRVITDGDGHSVELES